MKAREFVLGLMLSAAVGGGMAIGGYKLLENENQTTQQVSPNTNVRYTSDLRSSNVIVPEGLNFVDAAASVTPAVVHVMTEYSAQQQQGYGNIDPFFRDFFGDSYPGYGAPRGPQQGSG